MYALHRETFYLAQDFFDRFMLTQKNINKSMLQLIGITSLFIASKLEVRSSVTGGGYWIWSNYKDSDNNYFLSESFELDGVRATLKVRREIFSLPSIVHLSVSWRVVFVLPFSSSREGDHIHLKGMQMG